MLYSLVRPYLFSLDPELAHDLTLKLANLCPVMGKLTGLTPSERLGLTIGNLKWPMPIGLAAGVDKNAQALDFFSAQGFGAIECGTITLKPQWGNSKPRMFRYPNELSLRNSMGFPNEGLLNIYPKLKYKKISIPIGANIGKNKDSTKVESIQELTLMYSTLVDYVDYFVVNVSSPNTPGLRELQEKSYLEELFSELNLARSESLKDLYLKISPDLSPDKVIELAHLSYKHKLTGIIATNTTIMPERGSGGISGQLLKQKSYQVQKLILAENLPLEVIGVGGISTPEDLFNFWKIGGKVAQVYSAYVYQGPDLLKSFHHALIQFLDSRKFKNLEAFFALPLSERQYLLNKN